MKPRRQREKLLGEKRDVKAWLTWLVRYAHKEVSAIKTPIGMLPRYDDLQQLFTQRVGKAYPRDLYDKQFSLYIDHIVARIDLQLKAYGKEENLPPGSSKSSTKNAGTCCAQSTIRLDRQPRAAGSRSRMTFWPSCTETSF